MKRRPPPPRSSPWRRGRVPAAVTLVMLAVAFGIVHVLRSNDTVPRRQVTETVMLKLIQPPPPPPPPPVERPPPPEQTKLLEQPKLENKEPDKPKAPDKPPPGPLAVDAKGGPGSDGFGLAGNPGGSPLIGGSGGGGGSPFGHYAMLVSEEIKAALEQDDKLRAGHYHIVLSMWLSSLGKPERVLLIKSTGDAAVDQQIQQALAKMPALSEAPPRDMPQPVNLAIDAKPAG